MSLKRDKKVIEFVSVIIVNWNGLKWLEDCINSLLIQTYPNIEIICVDNASTDGSVNFLRKKYKSKIKIIKSDTNSGFAGGNNLGYRYAQGSFILLINNDTVSDTKLVEDLVEGFSEIPQAGILQPKIVSMNNNQELDVCGAYWTNSTFLYYFGLRKNASDKIYNIPKPFFSIKAAAVMIRRNIIDEIGLFDDDFWCYYEETDFCHRAWMNNYESWYYPKATIQHAGGGTALTYSNEYIQFHNFKNKLLSIMKNFEMLRLLIYIPLFTLISIVISFVWLLSGKPKLFISIYKSIIWNVVHIKQTFLKRREIQLKRTVSDRVLLQKTMSYPQLIYYYYALRGKPWRYGDK